MTSENKLDLIVSYYLARYDNLSYSKLGYGTPTETHETIGKIFGLSPNTIEMNRNRFYSHTGKIKIGFRKPPSGSEKKILNDFQAWEEFELRKKVELILKPNTSKQEIFNDIEIEEIRPDERKAIEGELIERKTLSYKRNAAIATACKERDHYTCQSCGFRHEDKIVECHHLEPLSITKESVISIDQLITLCPTCHRLAHQLLNKDNTKYTKRPVLLDELKNLLLSKITG